MFLITQWGQQPNSNHQNQKIKYKHSVKKIVKKLSCWIRKGTTWVRQDRWVRKGTTWVRQDRWVRKGTWVRKGSRVAAKK